MVAITVEIALKPEVETKAKAGGRFDLAFAIYLAAGRFGSPAGMAFIQQNYVPALLVRKG